MTLVRNAELPQTAESLNAVPPVPRHRATYWAVFSVVMLAIALYSGAYLKRGWVPHDEGTLGQSAERVLHGELPHRDFDALYTGGLDMLNAAAFGVVGVGSLTMRYVLFAFFIGSMAAVFYICSRFAGMLAAGAATLLAAAWSLPNYSAPMPSWYNLFLALFGTAALLRYIDCGDKRWILLAGVCAGCSFLVKLTGLFYIASVALFLVFEANEDAPSDGRLASRWYSIAVGAGLVLFVAALAVVVSRTDFRLSRSLTYFLVPPAALAALALWRTWTHASQASWRALITKLGYFAAGALLPVFLFLTPYLTSGALGALLRGVFVLPAVRLQHVAKAPPPEFTGVYVILIIAAAAMLRRWATSVALVLGALLLALFWRSAWDRHWYSAAWNSAAAIVPWTAIVAVLAAEKLFRDDTQQQRRRGLIAAAAAMVMCSFVQFPLAAPVYFCFVAPLVVVTWVALASTQTKTPRTVYALLVAFYLAFSVFRTVPTYIYALGSAYRTDNNTYTIMNGRAAGLRVDEYSGKQYDDLVAAIHSHVQSGYIFATPNCPEVYFLSGLQNPTRILFDGYGTAVSPSAVLHALEEKDVRVVVLANTFVVRIPGAPPPSTVSPELRAALAQTYPHETLVGAFSVRWKDQ